ncbi:MAG TPA: GNAT family N-acetyltransferase, partial [Acidimicrobiales bacterium]|nr:GNAT family N-acetyltransferase [Acidimicrobiales bacterium]
VAFRTGVHVDPAALLTRADSFFSRLGRGFTVKVRDDGADEDLRAACTAAGLEPFGGTAPEMILRRPVPKTPTIEGVILRVVDDVDGLRAFQEVNAAAYATYGMPAEVLSELFDRSDAVLGDGGAHVVLARRGDEPVATAMAYESDGVASLQWVGTVPAARGIGLGAQVTAAATNLVFARGASSCTLQASAMGEPVYRRLGYEALYGWAEYVRWPRPPKSPGRGAAR